MRVAEALNSIGATYMSEGKPQDAFAYLNKSLDMYVRIVGSEEHLTIANVLNNVGLSYRDVNDFDKAVDYVNRSMEIKKKVFKTDTNLSIAESYATLGWFSCFNSSVKFQFTVH